MYKQTIGDLDTDFTPIKWAHDAIDKQTSKYLKEIALADNTEEYRKKAVKAVEENAHKIKEDMEYEFNQRGVYA